MNKLYFTRVVEKTRGLFTSSPPERESGVGWGGVGWGGVEWSGVEWGSLKKKVLSCAPIKNRSF